MKLFSFFFLIVSIFALTGCASSKSETSLPSDTQETSQAGEMDPSDGEEVVSEIEGDYSGEYTLDVQKSTFGWAGAKVVGSAHTGTIEPLEGSLIIDEAQITQANVVIDMSTIISTDSAGGEMLDNHLKSADFFDVENYPTSTLVVHSADRNQDGTYTFHGTLEILGIANDLDFIGTVTETRGEITMMTEFMILRETYGIGSGFKGAILEDELYFDVTVVFVK